MSEAMGYIRLPELGEGISQATLACWHCQEGSQIRKDDDVAEVVTDKATFNIAADCQGTVRALCADPGETVCIGDILIEVELQS